MHDPLSPPADLAEARARLAAAVTAELSGLAGVDPGGPEPGQGALSRLTAASLANPAAVIGPSTRVVVADTVLWQASLAELARLATALGRERPLLFLEPTSEVGWRALTHRVGAPLWRRLAGHGFDRDVPGALRSVDLVVTDLNRFGTGVAGVRSYAIGRAERIR